MSKFAIVIATVSMFAAATFGQSADNADRFWAQWRGPLSNGVAPKSNPPVEWSENKNVRWKFELSGKSHAAPIIWGDRVYLLAAVDSGKLAPGATEPKPESEDRGGRRRRFRQPPPTNIYAFKVIALDRKTGKVVWDKTLAEALPHEAGHPDSTQASASPVTDGEQIIAYFGSRGVFGLDMEGNVLWSKDLGKMRTRNQFGEGSSPALYGNTVVIQWDHEGDDFIVALDKRTGKELWRTPRDESTGWATPIIIEVDGKPQVIANAAKRIRGYDLATGEQIWECGGMTTNAIPSPVYADGILYCFSGFRGSAALAIRVAGAKGDLTGTDAIIWDYHEATPYVPSPLLYKGALYFFDGRNRAILSCLDARTGAVHYSKKRLEGLRNIYASPVAAGDRVYLPDRDGVTMVLKQGSAFEVLATNTLDDGFDASPAIAGDELYLRGRKYLYCIARDVSAD